MTETNKIKVAIKVVSKVKNKTALKVAKVGKPVAPVTLVVSKAAAKQAVKIRAVKVASKTKAETWAVLNKVTVKIAAIQHLNICPDQRIRTYSLTLSRQQLCASC